MPSIILTSQFTAPTAQSFTDYLKYMTRKEALKSEVQKSEVNQRELQKIERYIKKFDMQHGASIDETFSKNTRKELEATTILKSINDFEDKQDFTKYISYMSRHYALETSKKTLSSDEEIEMQLLKEKLVEFHKEESINEVNQKQDNQEDELILNGAFSIDKKVIRKKDIPAINEIIKNAQNNGSVFYQDVVSFDTDFLIKEGIYDDKEKVLDEQRLQQASNKMMDKLFEDEGIEQGYWFATIHRNTEHIHIHFGSVEMQNTRPLVTVMENGIEYKQPKGKRKQQTIDSMKSVFVNELVDRTSSLSRLSTLRDSLVQEVKEEYSSAMDKQKLKVTMQEIYHALPANKKNWAYDSKHISNELRGKIDYVTETLMKTNPNFKEFMSLTKEEGNFRKEIYGETTRENKNYEENKRKEIYKRLGNSLLKEMKKQSNNQMVAADRYLKNNNRKIKKEPVFRKKFFNQVSLYSFKKALHDDYEKYRAQRDYERVQQQIALERERNSY